MLYEKYLWLSSHKDEQQAAKFEQAASSPIDDSPGERECDSWQERMNTNASENSRPKAWGTNIHISNHFTSQGHKRTITKQQLGQYYYHAAAQLDPAETIPP